MAKIKEINLKKPIHIKGSNSNFKILGEEIEKPYLDYAGQNTEEKTEDFYEIVENEKTTITIKPDFEYEKKHTIKLHLPKEAKHSITAETNNGIISYANLNGSLEANTRNGKIELENLKGKIVAICANGSIESKNIDGNINFSSANGRIFIRESAIKGDSTLKSGNGRIFLQVNPAPTGSLSLFSGKGKIKLALSEHGNYNIKIKTKGRIFNNLEDCSTRTENESTIIQKGEGGFNFQIHNFMGGVSIVKYQDFDAKIDEGTEDSFKDSPFGEFFNGMFKCFEPSGHRKQKGFEDEIAGFFEKMVKFGSNFGKMGEEFSREFKESTGGNKNEGEIRVVLEMLQEGRISAEEAEKLINAIKAGRSRR